MISRYIILLLLSFSFQQFSIKFTPNQIINFTLLNGNQKYLILDLGNYLLGNKNGIMQLNHIYFQANIKTFIYLVSDISSYDSSFLNIVSSSIGTRFDGDSKANSYIFVIFAIESKRYIYRIGEKVKALIKEQELEQIIKANSKYLEHSIYPEFMNLFTSQLEKKILSKPKN